MKTAWVTPMAWVIWLDLVDKTYTKALEILEADPGPIASQLPLEDEAHHTLNLTRCDQAANGVIRRPTV
jgi:hypothetical protein